MKYEFWVCVGQPVIFSKPRGDRGATMQYNTIKYNVLYFERVDT